MPRQPRDADPHDATFRALAHGGRRRLLETLAAAGGRTLGELADRLPMTRQAVSQHLDLLEDAGLVVTRRHGREKLHYLNPTPLVETLTVWAEPLITAEARALHGLRGALERSAHAASRRHRKGA